MNLPDLFDLVVTAPGQGVQAAGMLDAWLSDVPEAADLLQEWSAAAGLDLLAASRDAAALADTATAQPVIVATGLLSWQFPAARTDLGSKPALFAGHSVGELTAAAAAGRLTCADAVRLARVRGLAMSRACGLARTGMAAAVPARRDPATDEAIVEAITAAGLAVANVNGCSQFVAAGPVEQLEEFSLSPAPGVRVLPLDVAGAFHTPAMASAVRPFADAVASAEVTDTGGALLGNADGAMVGDAADLRARLVAQVTGPVRWDLCASTIERRSSVNAVHVELAPAGPLTSLRGRATPTAHTVAVRTPADAESLGGLVVLGAQ